MWECPGTYCPPKSCIPSKANTTMNRNSRNRRLMIDFIELSRDTTRLRREFQYLQKHSIITTALIQPLHELDCLLFLRYINYAFFYSITIQRSRVIYPTLIKNLNFQSNPISLSSVFWNFNFKMLTNQNRAFKHVLV